MIKINLFMWFRGDMRDEVFEVYYKKFGGEE